MSSGVVTVGMIYIRDTIAVTDQARSGRSDAGKLVPVTSALSAVARAMQKYVQCTKNLPPSPLLLEALPLLTRRETALDVGAGGLRDTRCLLDAGFQQVCIVDREPQVAQLVSTLPLSDRISCTITSFEMYTYASYDLINAQFALPFAGKACFNMVFTKLIASLNHHGVLTGQLFGVHDEWNRIDSPLIFHDLSQAQQLFENLHVIKLEEVEVNNMVFDGTPKHWHYFNIIAVKQ